MGKNVKFAMHKRCTEAELSEYNHCGCYSNKTRSTIIAQEASIRSEKGCHYGIVPAQRENEKDRQTDICLESFNRSNIHKENKLEMYQA